jgi:phage portal protein BeeE
MSQIWPVVEPRTLERQVWNTETARAIPGLAMAMQLYAGLISSCALELVKGYDVLETPSLLQQPDPDEGRSWFVEQHVNDWWLHGNACHLVTARSARTGWPAAGRWFPAHRWSILEDRDTSQPVYHLDGKRVDRANVVHVKRGADPSFPYRGMGVVEQHVRTLNRAGLEEAAETASLSDRGMPAVAVITPQAEPRQQDLDAAAVKWEEKFHGPERKPGFFPKDTQVIPLSWNPKEGQMVEARKMTVRDVASIFALDPYWLGAEGSSHTYRSPGPLFQTLLKLSLGPVMDKFEDTWSQAWVERGKRVRFDRVSLQRDDLTSMVQAFSTGARFFPDPNEARRYMGFAPLPDDAFTQQQPEPPAPPAADEQDPATEEEASA